MLRAPIGVESGIASLHPQSRSNKTHDDDDPVEGLVGVHGMEEAVTAFQHVVGDKGC